VKRLDGRIALITGAGRGIGWATAQAFAAEGAHVILNGRQAELLEQRATELREQFSASVECLAYDVSSTDAVRTTFAGIFQRHRRLDVLVNNAGILRDALLGMIPRELIDDTLQTNVVGPILHMQEASRLMGRKQSGSIINVASIIGRVGNKGQTVYSASKAAVIGMTYAAAKELAPKGIRVNAVAPGFIATDMTKQLPPAMFEERVKSVGMGRIGEAADVAKAILFLASDESNYVTGQVIGVDGAMLI
jgi:3-oxoacyl-[acyl-carrier protein] reductase